jgi:thiamine-phosphate pyrophosphorylase
LYGGVILIEVIAADARLYLILTPSICFLDPLETARRALCGGAGMLQLRDKHSTDEEYLRLARPLAAICRRHGAPFILNDRVHLVEAADADGAHVGEDDMAPDEARNLLGPDRLLGLSTHDRDEVAAASGKGADYMGLGPMFDTTTKELARTPGGADLIRSVAGATTLPVYPIGGITTANAPTLIEAGATRLAVSAAICEASDPAAAARHLLELIR